MDVLITLHFFDGQHAFHKRRCGVDNLDVFAAPVADAPAPGVVRVTVSCPVCVETISGQINNTDWPKVVAILGEKTEQTSH